MTERRRRSYPCQAHVVLEGMTVRGLDRARLAARAGVSEKTVERLFRGENLSRTVIDALAGAIGRRFSDIVSAKHDCTREEQPRTFAVTVQAICKVPSGSLTAELADAGHILVAQLEARGLTVTAQGMSIVAADPEDNFVRRLADLIAQPIVRSSSLDLAQHPAVSGVAVMSLPIALRPSRYFELVDRLSLSPVPLHDIIRYGDLVSAAHLTAKDAMVPTTKTRVLPGDWGAVSIRPRMRHGLPVVVTPRTFDRLLRTRWIRGTM
jgi:transcriptional regulator with XRE-family HTH domain